MAAVDFALTRQATYAAGRTFGRAGSYEQLDGVLRFAVDPRAPANRSIVDLDRAPVAADGTVQFSADLSLVRPVDPERGDRRLLVELPNRGRRSAIDTFNRSGAEPAASPAPGDGFLFTRGYTVASIGWQWDVYRDPVLLGIEPPQADLSADTDADRGQAVVEIRPYAWHRTHLLADRVHQPLRAARRQEPAPVLYVTDHEDGEVREVPRSRWRFARETDAGVEASDQYVYLESGFEPGKYYQLVYSTDDAPVAGAGLLAFRDAAALLRDPSQQLLPALGAFDCVLGYGVSQTGRLLRELLYLGLNVDERGRVVFDGLLPHVAGARRGSFNHRYAQPSNQSYPGFGHLFPFADEEQDDPLSGMRDGLLQRLRHPAQPPGATPKVVYTNSSAEYWRGDCSLMHTDPTGRSDVDAPAESRIYHFAGTQHGAGKLPQTRSGAPEGAIGRYQYNVVDHSPLLRAALVNLEQWVTAGTPPPPSMHPRLADGTAVTRAEVLDAFDRLPAQVTPDRSRLWVIRTIDLGPRAAAGVGRYPPVEGATYACLVAAVDADGNEIAGIRLPDLTQPVATHAGWNLRDPVTGAPEQQIPMQGFSRWFAGTAEQRHASGDPRRSIAERYADRAAYVDAVRGDAERLVVERYLLAADLELVVSNAAERFDTATQRAAAPAAAVDGSSH